jgi:negative regulator of sigma E activity
MAPRRTARPLLRPVAGFAIAASVAALAVVGIKQTAPEQQLNGTPEIATTAPAVTESVQLATARPDANARPDIEVIEESLPAHRRLNSYLVKFNEQRSSLGVPGVNPYVRIVGFESD